MMRHFDGAGVEYGTCCVIEHILSEELQEVDQDELILECGRSIYWSYDIEILLE